MNTKLSILFFVKRTKTNIDGLLPIFIRESVSKMLGHKNLHTTQHYAKILDLKVSNDMHILKEKFGSGIQIGMKKTVG